MRLEMHYMAHRVEPKIVYAHTMHHTLCSLYVLVRVDFY
jgi:hypothetical protein